MSFVELMKVFMLLMKIGQSCHNILFDDKPTPFEKDYNEPIRTRRFICSQIIYDSLHFLLREPVFQMCVQNFLGTKHWTHCISYFGPDVFPSESNGGISLPKKATELKGEQLHHNKNSAESKSFEGIADD